MKDQESTDINHNQYLLQTSISFRKYQYKKRVSEAIDFIVKLTEPVLLIVSIYSINICIFIYENDDQIKLAFFKCMCKTDDLHQRKILIRYLEFSNLKEVCIEYAKFTFNYKKNIMRIDIPDYRKRAEFNIYDFIAWDQANYPNDPCFVS